MREGTRDKAVCKRCLGLVGTYLHDATSDPPIWKFDQHDGFNPVADRMLDCMGSYESVGEQASAN